MKTIRVACAVIQMEDKILAVQRSEHMKMPLKWEFPGGKIENHEDVITCIHREIQEELNIQIEIEAELPIVEYSYPDFNIELVPFLARHLSGEIRLTEHKTYLLLSRDQLRDLDWAEADVPVLRHLRI
ncbi:MAG: hypothetical protein RLZZ262_2379 [Bacteroidota bacterium]